MGIKECFLEAQEIYKRDYYYMPPIFTVCEADSYFVFTYGSEEYDGDDVICISKKTGKEIAVDLDDLEELGKLKQVPKEVWSEWLK